MAKKPLTLQQQMKLWRRGYGPLPAEYIARHEEAARADLTRFAAAQGVRVLHTEMVRDGWGDGMRVLRVVAEGRTGFRDFRWSDSNGGSWFEAYPSGGQGLVEVPVTNPGRM